MYIFRDDLQNTCKDFAIIKVRHPSRYFTVVIHYSAIWPDLQVIKVLFNWVSLAKGLRHHLCILRTTLTEYLVFKIYFWICIVLQTFNFDQGLLQIMPWIFEHANRCVCVVQGHTRASICIYIGLRLTRLQRCAGQDSWAWRCRGRSACSPRGRWPAPPASSAAPLSSAQPSSWFPRLWEASKMEVDRVRPVSEPLSQTYESLGTSLSVYN